MLLESIAYGLVGSTPSIAIHERSDMRITIHDCKENTFSVSGSGGQRRDHTNTGVRLVHEPSGAVAEGRQSRKQSENRREAFLKLVNSKIFQNWYHKQLGLEPIEVEQVTSVIRTYNLVDKRVTDHQTKQKTSQVYEVLDGNLDIIRSL